MTALDPYPTTVLPPAPAPTAATLAAWIRATLGADFPRATNGIWQHGDGRPVRRLGVARVGSKAVAAQAQRLAADALLLHRPWGLGALAEHVAVLAFHEALDERLTTGNNPWLAQRLGFTLSETLGERRGQPLVALARAPAPLTVETVLARLASEGFTVECWNPLPPTEAVQCIALGNAMRPALVVSAAACGAHLYLTGTLRPATRPFLTQVKMAALGLGHAASERWGLHWLAGALAARFALTLLWLDEE